MTLITVEPNRDLYRLVLLDSKTTRILLTKAETDQQEEQAAKQELQNAKSIISKQEQRIKELEDNLKSQY